MTTVDMKSVRWMLPAFAATIALAGINSDVFAQPNTTKTQAKTTQKAPRPRSKTAEGTLIQATPTALKMKYKTESFDITLTPGTQYYRKEMGLQASELKTGDKILFKLKGTDGLPTIDSLSPLTLKFSNSTLLTLSNDPKMRFDRISSLSSSELAAGQTTKVASNVFPNGTMEAREVWLIIKPARKIAAKK